MRLLIVIGAGASYDSWLPGSAIHAQRLPLANNLFSKGDPQDKLIHHYGIAGLADKLRRRLAESEGDAYDIEAELESLQTLAANQNDIDRQLELFKARFYIQALIHDLSNKTNNGHHGLTVYVTLLEKLKAWINESPNTREVDIIIFNYDDLIEQAMQQVYGIAWHEKSKIDKMHAYYMGENLRIYKPHGSINWGRVIREDFQPKNYNRPEELFPIFYDLDIINKFHFVEPTLFEAPAVKSCIPAIAIPYKTKTGFDECPPAMLAKMKIAIASANRFATFGWKGGDKHVADLIYKNGNIKKVSIVSPSGESNLDKSLMRNTYRVGFSDFVCKNTPNLSLEHLLTEEEKTISSRA